MSRNVLINNLLVLSAFVMLLVACAPAGIYHTVQPGQTLYRIAKTYGIEEDHLARINNIKDPTQLKASQKIFIPGVYQLRQVPTISTSSNPPRDLPPTQPPSPPESSNVASKPAANNKTVAKPPAVPSVAPSATNKPVQGIFIWPAKGKVLNKFGTQGQKVYKGIEIGLPEGTSVVAAASGKVIYSGNAIPGYGNLVILEHSDSFFSVYGFNQKNLVKMNDHVGQGERIALSGQPPSGQSARLHFEIRKGKSAVNPILYLP